MGVGYTTMMYDAADIDRGLRDIAACRYDGAEIWLEKIRTNGPDTVERLLEENGLDLYCVMSEWLENEAALERVANDLPMVADLGAEFIGLLPPQRWWQDDETVQKWFRTIAEAAIDAGVTPLVHYHGATHVESAAETRHLLASVDDLKLLWDTAHYYSYGEHFPDGDVTDDVDRFADDIAYVHLKEVAAPIGFADVQDSLTEGNFHLDNVINYFRSFTDLGEVSSTSRVFRRR